MKRVRLHGIKIKRSREPKYRNKPVVVDGTRFASKREAKRYMELKQLQQAGLISGMKLQVPFEVVSKEKYIADFVYFDEQRKEEVVEDVKGYRTAVYKRKKKLMRQQHGIEIKEV